VDFAFDERLFGLLATSDIDDGDGDADDLVGLVAGGMKGDEVGALFVEGVGVGVADFEAGTGFAFESAAEVGFTEWEDGRHDLGDVAAEMGGDWEMVHLGEALVDADVAEVAVDEAEADGDAVVDGVELGEALGRESFEAEGKRGIGCWGAWFGSWGFRVESGGEDFRELFGRDGAAVEPALAEVAAEPEEHVGDGLGFDAFGDGGETEAVAKADDGGGDFAAVAGVVHGADETGIDFELVEGEGLEVAEAGVAGAEVVECETGALLFEFGGDAVGVLGVAGECALGDLEDETAEGKAGLFGGGTDVFGEREVGELGEGDVDGEGEVLGDVFCGGEDGSEEVAGELAVEAGLFGERDELVGGDEAADGMLPTREDFESAEQARAKLYQRLKVWENFVLLERSAQIVRVFRSHGKDDTTARMQVIEGIYLSGESPSW
jgi:hypothetical protein